MFNLLKGLSRILHLLLFGKHCPDSFPSQAGSHVGPKGTSSSGLRVLRHGEAMRVMFYYPTEEGTYIDQPTVTLYENGIVQLNSPQEETMTHIRNCEILWRFETDPEDQSQNKVRLLKPKTPIS